MAKKSLSIHQPPPRPPPPSSSSLENDTFHGTFTYFSRFYERRLKAGVDITWRLAVDAAIPRRNPKVPKKVYPLTAVCSLPCPSSLTGGSSSRGAITEH